MSEVIIVHSIEDGQNNLSFYDLPLSKESIDLVSEHVSKGHVIHRVSVDSDEKQVILTKE